MPIDDDVRPSWSDGWPNPRRIGASWWVHVAIPDRKDDQAAVGTTAQKKNKNKNKNYNQMREEDGNEEQQSKQRKAELPYNENEKERKRRKKTLENQKQTTEI